MKLIVATIRPETLSGVQEALAAAAEEGAQSRITSACEVSDLRRPERNVYRGSQYGISRLRLRLEIVVENDGAVDRVVDAVVSVAGMNGGRWNGEDLFVMNVDSYRPVARGARAAHA
jgi:nitrogen regulatory protein PII